MSAPDVVMKSRIGQVSWIDLTVKNAAQVRDFYREVVGWKASEVDMEGYSDYNMKLDGNAVVGICHARGVNANLPPQWIIYVMVQDLEKSLARCQALGGRIVDGPRSLGESGRFCVIQDPAGAGAPLWEKT